MFLHHHNLRSVYAAHRHSSYIALGKTILIARKRQFVLKLILLVFIYIRRNCDNGCNIGLLWLLLFCLSELANPESWLTHPPLDGGSHSDTDQDCAIKLMSA